MHLNNGMMVFFLITQILTFVFKRDHKGAYQRERERVKKTTVLYLVYILFFKRIVSCLFTLFTLRDTVTLLILHPQSQKEGQI